MAIAVKIIYTPMGMVTGGITGISIVVYTLFGIPVGLTNWVLNIPLLIVGGKQKGKAFFKKTCFAVFCFSVMLLLIPEVNAAQEDFWLAALLGGILNGTGLGLVISCETSTGGSDLAATLLRGKNKRYTTAQYIMMIDSSIVLAGAFVFDIYHALYAIATVYITSNVMDGILSGIQFGKLVIIVSEENKKIAETIMEAPKRGATMVKGIGMYTKSERDILFCVVSKKEIKEVLDIIHRVDEKAFVIITDTKEVYGKGFVQGA